MSQPHRKRKLSAEADKQKTIKSFFTRPAAVSSSSEDDVARAQRITAEETSFQERRTAAFRVRLLENLQTLGMEVRTDVPPDGNCFFHCVRDQQNRLGLQEPDHVQLRKDVNTFLRNLSAADPLWPHITDQYLTNIAKNGIYADAIVVQAMARMIGRDIHIVTSQQESSRIGYLMNKILAGDIESSLPPVLIGQIGEEHFVSLTLHQTRDSENDEEKEEESVSSSPTEGESIMQSPRDDIDRPATVRKPKCQSTVCCKDAVNPFQPQSDTVLSKLTRISSGRPRYFQRSWFLQYPWLHLCTTDNKVYCFFCMRANQQGCKPDAAFVWSGFDNWKKALEKFSSHEKSSSHGAAVYDVKCRQSTTSVYSRVTCQHETEQKKHLQSLMNELKSLQFLLRQGLPLRGHDEQEGNLQQLLKICFGEGCKEKTNTSSKYLSHDIVNEILGIMAHKVLRSVVLEIREANWFSILADETRDVANREQVVICIRWVTEQFEVIEEPVGLVHVDNTCAETIFNALKDCLIRLDLPVQKCRGQAYDGASNFQGHVSGVAKRFKDEVPSAVSVHCLAHSVNLVLQEASRKVKVIRDALDFATEVIQLIKLSPKRQVLFETIQHETLTSCSPSIKPLCPTRWTVRTRAFDALIENYEALQETLELVSQGHDEYARRASGILALMQQFSTFLGLSLSRDVFAVTEELATAVQRKQTSCVDATNAANLCLRTLENMRQDKSFQTFFAAVSTKAANVCDEPRIPRQRQPPRRLDEGSQGHSYSDPSAYYRQQYYEAIDNVKEHIKRRFDQQSLKLPRKIETLLGDGAAGKNPEIPQEIKDTYAADIDMDRLKTQLAILPHALGDNKKSIFEALPEELTASDTVKRMLSKVDKLIRLYLTIPVTTATAERSFSALKRVKTYLRSTMTQERLNNCLIMHVFKDKVDQLNLAEISSEFVCRNERRQSYFGKLNV